MALAHARLLPIAAIFAAASVASIAWIDEPLARWIHTHARGLEAFWLAGTEGLDAASGMDLAWRYFAAAAFVVAGAVAASAPGLRAHARGLWFVAVVHLASRVSANLLKSCFGRLRPFQWIEAGEPAHTFFTTGVSFPSGHVTYYLGLCLPLALLYPRLRLWILAVPGFLVLARVGAEQHFLADTLGAVAWVMVVTWLVRLAFDRTAGRAATATMGDA